MHDTWQPEAPLILVVEDNPLNVEFMDDILTLHGYRLMIARDGLTALTYIQRSQPALILADIRMPGMSGIELIQIIRATPALCEIPIIALTALVMPGDCERCLAAGANAYLSKPISISTLLENIQAQLSQQPATTAA